MPSPTAAAVSQFVSTRGDMGPKYDLTLLSNKVEQVISTTQEQRDVLFINDIGRMMNF